MLLRTLCGRKKLLLFGLSLSMLALLAYLVKCKHKMHPLTAFVQHSKELVWWTDMPTGYSSIRYCGTRICRFSGDRHRMSEAQGVLFYASAMSIADLPLPRQQDHIWALLHEESPRNVPYIGHIAVLQHFNYTATFSRYSDMPLTTQYLRHPELLTSAEYMVPIGQKTLFRAEGLAPIVFLQSDCDTMSGRDEYVRQLMQYISVDSYGGCLNNRQLPKSLKENYLNRLYAPELLHLLAKYKFVLSYENGICEDYISEKFWRPLIIGSVPIYYGSPTIKDWQPSPQSVIHIGDFASPQSLAAFIERLDRNDTAYNAYLQHKYEQTQPIRNGRLRRELSTRLFPNAEDELFGTFECFACHKLHETQAVQSHMATVAHYNCPVPIVYPPMITPQNGHSEDWTQIMAAGACQARVLNTLWQRNTNYTRAKFEQELQQAYNNNMCN